MEDMMFRESQAMSRLSRTYKISRPDGRSAKPIYIYKFSVVKENNKEEYIWNWMRRSLAEEAVKRLIRDLKPNNDLFVIDLHDNLLYALFDMLTAECTNQINDDVFTIKFHKSGPPIRDLSDCAARPEARRMINCLLLTDVKKKSDSSVVTQTERNVGRVFGDSIETENEKDVVKVNTIIPHGRACCGLAASIHRVPARSLSDGLELKLSQDLGCFYGQDDWLEELQAKYVAESGMPPNIIRQEFRGLSIRMDMRYDGKKTYAKFNDCNGNLLLSKQTKVGKPLVPGLEVPEGIKIAYEDMSCLLTPIGCLLPLRVWTPAEIRLWAIFERTLLYYSVDEFKSARTNPRKRVVAYERKADKFIKQHNSLLNEFGFKLEPSTGQLSEFERLYMLMFERKIYHK